MGSFIAGQHTRVIAPRWNAGKLRVLEKIQAELSRRGSRQGAKYAGPASPPGWRDAARTVPTGR